MREGWMEFAKEKWKEVAMGEREGQLSDNNRGRVRKIVHVMYALCF